MLTSSPSVTGAQLSLHVHRTSDEVTPVTVAVTEAYNFGYAARDREGVQEHVDQMRALGFAAPQQVPAIFPIPPDRISTASEFTVSGEQTYGEVEFALINSEEHGWLVTIGSDHTDLEVEGVKMPKAKAMCPDVVGATAWRLDEVRDDWDRFTMTMWAESDDGATTQLQHDVTGHLLAPHQLISILEDRRPGALPVGTVIMSGTVAGEPTPGMRGWSARLEDPETGRRIELGYTLRRLSEEI
ncbi:MULTISPECIES: DUF2848 family protein [unclassified Mycolicibacterium]|uniref:DUF2848 family protein n=1 Tax=unclassified Mycolicibacterium TaxID=2636767 RepID=UPI001F4BFA02|nr:DUF2848 family protein [Mycolicibacterium sp. YH-1]UNB52211.1 DUF2848 domain-containing protein [Mycolicibacterium sp. YH-1]